MAKKGQTFQAYTEELKREVVRLKVEESDAQIASWVKKVQNNESFEDQRGVWNHGTVRIFLVSKRKMPI